MWLLDQVKRLIFEVWHKEFELIWMNIILDDLKVKYEAPTKLFFVTIDLPLALLIIRFNMT